ncbi:class I SAM-dependent methyltransferase [Larkinella insperata]|uniref:Class I SAM-dependent methyltransferase n=1 Tax=Larkinella insperata TaxID=332158 RepID=A0ABW3Q9Z6_9BACT|nr:class I SAM-dependent methyltransferase [Larkinella insperata]
MTCHICNTPSNDSFQVKVLFKYDVTYYRCRECGFIQTESPYWLPEAYESAITSLDIGLVSRNVTWAPTVEAIIRKWFRPEGPFLDYGGGYGLFVRMMRDRGFAFIRQDQYCENLFAKHFDMTDQPPGQTYELVTAFEVFEHLPDPVATVDQMLQAGKSILFSTKVQPNPNVTPETWWYFIPETGQHVALYSLESLQRLAKRFGLQLFSDGHDLHLMTAKSIDPTWFRWLTHPRKVQLFNRFHSYKARPLLDQDFQKVYDSVKTQPLKDLI